MIKIDEKSIMNGGGGVSSELQKEQQVAGNENKGRTPWDFLSEIFSACTTKPPFNWYKFFCLCWYQLFLDIQLTCTFMNFQKLIIILKKSPMVLAQSTKTHQIYHALLTV